LVLWWKGTLECFSVFEYSGEREEGSTKWHKANDESYRVTFTQSNNFESRYLNYPKWSIERIGPDSPIYGHSFTVRGSIKFASLIGSQFDSDRYGLVPRSGLERAYLIVTTRTVIMKKAPSVVRLIIQKNAQTKICSCHGNMYYHRGIFGTDSYSTVHGIEKLIPVDVYSLGCPPGWNNDNSNDTKMNIRVQKCILARKC
jgi:NADH:ubiquinone oxidoreductase subunit B-like Fe-S oxidoreductase